MIQEANEYTTTVVNYSRRTNVSQTEDEYLSYLIVCPDPSAHPCLTLKAIRPWVNLISSHMNDPVGFLDPIHGRVIAAWERGTVIQGLAKIVRCRG